MEHECYGYVDLFDMKNNQLIYCVECGKELGAQPDPRKGLGAISNKIANKKKIFKKYLTFSPESETIDVSTPIGDKMPEFKVQREYTNWEEITVEAESQEQALELAEDDESLWDYAVDVNSYNYTGETWVGQD